VHYKSSYDDDDDDDHDDDDHDDDDNDDDDLLSDCHCKLSYLTLKISRP